jgi:activator of HSP90 ATPase
MSESTTLVTIIAAAPREIYEAWLDSSGHSRMTGSHAIINPVVGGKFSAWDGYIEGTTLELQPYSRIVQAWRTSEFPPESKDSHLEILLKEVGEDKTEITVVHTEIPDGQAAEYRQGWEDYYFKPMLEYFGDE